eukprot:4478412-Amphidinium_carterae.1
MASRRHGLRCHAAPNVEKKLEQNSNKPCGRLSRSMSCCRWMVVYKTHAFSNSMRCRFTDVST